MDNEKLNLFKGIRESQQKLDYFLLGLSSALFAYMGEKYEPLPISFSQNTLELFAVIVFFLTVVTGFVRINTNINVMMNNYRVLDMDSNRTTIFDAYTAPDRILRSSSGNLISSEEAQIILSVISEQSPLVKKHMERQVNLSGFLSQLRNALIILGFSLMVSSKLFGVFQ